MLFGGRGVVSLCIVVAFFMGGAGGGNLSGFYVILDVVF